MSQDLAARITNLEAAVFGAAGSGAGANPIVLTGPQQESVAASNILSADGAVATPLAGVFLLTKGSAAAITLAAPIAGVDDGKIITFIAVTAFAHTVTAPSNTMNGNKHIATFTAAVGNTFSLQAYNGVWYTAQTERGVTLS